jgi:hypothetical protein
VTVSAGQAQDAATAAAQKTATEQAYVHATTTAEAQGTSTQQAIIGLTATIQAGATESADKKTQEAPMMFARQTAVFAEARKTEIELQKTTATMWVSAWGPVFLILVVLLAGLFYLWKKGRVGVIQDENGRVRIIMINDRALQPDLMYSPVLDFQKNGVYMPELGVSETTQRQIVHETKVVEAVRALPQGYQRQALGLAGGISTPQSGPQINIQVVQPDHLAPVLDEVEGGLLED